jgi:orotate phosphoribosyltransferase
MEDTSVSIIEKITRRYSAPRKLENELLVSVYYDCIQLTPSDLARLAAESVGDLPAGSFDLVVGLAYTGIMFACAVAGGRQVGIIQANQAYFGPDIKGRRVVLVDDVIFTGKRLVAAQQLLEAQGAEVVGFACIVDRSEPQVLKTAKPIWSVLKTELK